MADVLANSSRIALDNRASFDVRFHLHAWSPFR
jgi:hypothetical protein